MPTKIECPMRTCGWEEDGECKYPKGICLKWRAAANMGGGNIVLMECLMLEIQQEKSEQLADKGKE